MKYQAFCGLMAKAPETQLDKSVADKFQYFVDHKLAPTSEQIQNIINDVRYYALGSQFAILALIEFQKQLVKDGL